MGEVCMVPPGLECCVGQRQVLLRPDPTKAYSRYLLYAIQSHDVQHQISWNEGTGSTVSNIRIPVLEGIKIPTPPLQVQEEIAVTLGAIDDKIALLRETNATLEAIAQALFKSWFVDFDPVRAKADGRDPEGVPPEVADIFPNDFEDSQHGAIPKGWRWGTLDEVSRSLRSTVNPKTLDDDTAYIGLEHMPRQSIALDSWTGASKVESGKSQFSKGQILFGKLRPYFHKVGIAPVDGVCSTDIIVIEPKSPDFGAFCVCHYSSKTLVDYATQLSNGAKMPRVNGKDLANFKIVLPPQEVARAFHGITNPMFDRIIGNIHCARSLAELRDTLLPRLMSGKLRIPDAQEISA